MRTRVQRWGNSLALRIPSALATETDLAEGSEVDVTVQRSKLVVTRSTQRFKLADLLSGITEDNLHGETWSEAPKGKEAW